MRFKINLSIDKNIFGHALPFSYQYELASFIYHTIAKGNASYSEWLHQNGFNIEGKHFRLFCFSPLMVDHISIDKDKQRLLLWSNTAQLQIGFLPERSTEEFVKGVFGDRQFTLGDRYSKVQFTINGIEMMPPAAYDGEITGTTLSPICLSRKGDDGHIKYFAPDDYDAARAIYNNLTYKYEAFYGKPYSESSDFAWETLSPVKSKLITIKVDTPQQTKIRAFQCKFRLKADNELLKIAYETGIGEKGSMGFGMIK